MPQIGELGRLARTLAVQPSIGVGGRGVRLIAALLAVKIPLTIASGSRRFAAPILGTKALHAGPRLDKRAVDREMIVRQQNLDRLLIPQRGYELPANFTLNQALTVLGKHRLGRYHLIQRQPDKPPEQQLRRLTSRTPRGCVLHPYARRQG